ncbi:MAG TPA: ABC transporter substrate-binding protein [Chloroflexota bacterium]|jgi:NitT/TauT family transport system substrate-binding protein
MRWRLPFAARTLVLTLVVALAACSAGGSAPAPPPPAPPATAAAPPSAPGATTNAQSAPAPTAAAPAAPSSLVPVKAGLLASASDAGIYVGDEKGYYRQQGIEIRYEQTDTVSTIPMLSTGQIDVGGPAVSPALINAFIRGVDLKMVADKGSVSSRANSYAALVVRKDLLDSGAVRDYADLRGRTVALVPPRGASPNAVDFSRALARGGLTEDDVNLVELAYPDMNAAFASKAIDVSETLEPLITAGINQGLFGRWKTIDELTDFRQYAAIGYAPAFFRDRPEVARRFMVGYVQAVRAYNDAFFKGVNRPEIVNVLVKHTSLKDPALYDQVVPPGLNPDGAIGLQSLQDDVAWYRQKGVIEQDLDLARVVDNQYVEYALQQLGKYQP